MRHVAAGRIDPIEQFTIKPLVNLHLFGIDISFTNAAFFMALTAGLAVLVMVIGTSRRHIVPGRLQTLAEQLYEFVAGTVRSSLGEEGMRFLPLVFSLFIFVLIANLMGLVPGAYTVTSQIVVTLAFAMLVMTVLVVVGISKHGLSFFQLFAPSGVPKALYPIIIPIEVISFLSRPASLSIRLFANMLAGHIALKVFAYFIIGLVAAGGWVALSPLPMVMIVALYALELLVAVLQAFVFSVLTCIYLNDALHPHH